MAMKEKDDWVFNPPMKYTIKEDSTLIVMTTPEERKKLEEKYSK